MAQLAINREDVEASGYARGISPQAVMDVGVLCYWTARCMSAQTTDHVGHVFRVDCRVLGAHNQGQYLAQTGLSVDDPGVSYARPDLVSQVRLTGSMAWTGDVMC